MPPSFVQRVCLWDEEWRARKAQAIGCQFERGTGMPAKLSSCRQSPLLPTVPACRTALLICLPNGEPRTGPSTASSLERDSLLLTHPVAGATGLVFASLSFGSSGNSRPPLSTRANAQNVCARSDGRIAMLDGVLKIELLSDCDKAVR